MSGEAGSFVVQVEPTGLWNATCLDFQEGDGGPLSIGNDYATKRAAEAARLAHLRADDRERAEVREEEARRERAQERFRRGGPCPTCRCSDLAHRRAS